jgi:hypothetical protein
MDPNRRSLVESAIALPLSSTNPFCVPPGDWAAGYCRRRLAACQDRRRRHREIVATRISVAPVADPRLAPSVLNVFDSAVAACSSWG